MYGVQDVVCSVWEFNTNKILKSEYDLYVRMLHFYKLNVVAEKIESIYCPRKDLKYILQYILP